MNDLLYALGRSLIKLIIGVILGIAVALMTLGGLGLKRPEWEHRGPPEAVVMLGVGAGLLTGAVTLLILFFGPWAKRVISETPWAERPELPRDESLPRSFPQTVPRAAVEAPSSRPMPPPPPKDGPSEYFREKM